MKVLKGFVLLLALGVLAACGAAPAPAGDTEIETQGPSVIYVTTTSGEFNEDGDCSLREAMTASLENRRVDACPAGHPVSQDTLVLQRNAVYRLYEVDNDTEGPTGLPAVVTDTEKNFLHIRGNGATVERSGTASFRIFYGKNGLSLSDLTVRKGHAVSGSGGGIYLTNEAVSPLVLSSLVVEDSRAEDSGGGIYAVGSYRIEQVIVRRNVAATGAGLALAGGAQLEDSLVIANKALITAGGLSLARGSVTNSSIVNNEAPRGGGLAGWHGHLYGVTVSGNIGGGAEGSQLNFYSSTIAANDGVGLTIGMTNLYNTLVANNSRDCVPRSGAYTSRDWSRTRYSLDSDKSCPLGSASGNLRGYQALLKPLATNGDAFRLTHAISPWSPAYNRGDPAYVTSSWSNQDGRGAPRVFAGRVDIGAYESLEYPTYTPPVLGGAVPRLP